MNGVERIEVAQAPSQNYREPMRLWMMKKLIRFFILGSVILLFPTYSHAQDDDSQDNLCASIVTDALQTVGSSCTEIGRNEICFGHQTIQVEWQDDVASAFETSGDRIPTTSIQSIGTSAINPETGDWGMTLMLAQSDFPDDEESAMTYALMGNAQIRAGSSVETTCVVSNQGTDNFNIRQAPNADGTLVGHLPVGNPIAATGRNAANDWIFVDDGYVSGWILGSLLTTNCDTSNLAIVDGSVPEPPPLQEFVLQTTPNGVCETAPDGLLIRSPEGKTSSVQVNGVDLIFSSTAYLTAQPDGEMMVRGLSGQIDVSANGESIVVLPETFTTIPMNGALQPSGPPSPSQQLDPSSDPLSPAFESTIEMLVVNGIGIEECTINSTETRDIFSGPADRFDMVGLFEANNPRAVLGTTEDEAGSRWWQLGETEWILTDLVNAVGDCSLVPTIEVDMELPTPTAEPTEVPTQTPTPEPTLEATNAPEAEGLIDVAICHADYGGVWFQSVPPNLTFYDSFKTDDGEATLNPVINGGISFELNLDGIDQGAPMSAEVIDQVELGCWDYRQTWRIEAIPAGTHTVEVTRTFETALPGWLYCLAAQRVDISAGSSETRTCTFTVE